MNRSGVITNWRYPIAVWLLLLGVVFVAEYSVMQILPWLLSEHPSRALEAALDAVVLTIILAPLLWWTIVRPLMEVIRLRARFLTDLFEHIESDRRQTAHDLHDGVGQSLTLLISGLRSAKKCRANAECSGRVNEFQRLAEESLEEVRRLSLGLRPSLLDDLGLIPALERLVEDVQAHHAITISFDAADVSAYRFPDRTATAVFRIVQEALTNIMKHSRATHVTICVRAAGGDVLVHVTDNGCGLDPSSLESAPAGHLGLRGMRERADLVGGRFSVDSSPGRGTHISVAIPIAGGECD